MGAREEVLRVLDELGIGYELTEHEPVFTMAAAARLDVPRPEATAKTLFVRDKKKRSYWLLVVPHDGRVDLAEVADQLGSGRLSLASPADLARMLGVSPGQVGPFAALNDAAGRVVVCLDESFEGGSIATHPNDNTATVTLSTVGLRRFLAAIDHPARALRV